MSNGLKRDIFPAKEGEDRVRSARKHKRQANVYDAVAGIERAYPKLKYPLSH